MKAKDLINDIKKEKPEIFKNLPEKKAQMVLRETFSQLAKRIESAEDGNIRVTGLGSFRIRSVASDKGGDTGSVKRVTFRPAKENPGA